MNRPSSTYRPTASSDTHSAVIVCFDFAGKEKDLETGLCYFGARYSTSFRDVSWQRPQASLGALLLKRYYDADLTTGWLSVDQMADKYPSISPYSYCAGNPMKLVDPDGREVGDYYSINGKWLGTDGKNDNVAYVASSVTYDTHGRVVTAKDKEILPISNSELLDRATWVCGESGGSNELITSRVQNAGDATKTLDATVADYYAAAINNMSVDTKGGFYEAIKVRMSRKDENGKNIYTSCYYFDGTGNAGNSQSRAFAAARNKGGNALNENFQFTNSIASVIRSLAMPDPTGGCRAWLGGVKYAKPYMDKSKSKQKASIQFSFESKNGYHSFYRN